MLLGQDGADEADQGVAGWEDTDDVGPAVDLSVESFLGVVGPDLALDLVGERGEREHVGPVLLEVVGEVG